MADPIKPYESNRTLSQFPLNLFSAIGQRDKTIGNFLNKAQILNCRLQDTEKGGTLHLSSSEKEGGSQRLYKDEVLNDKNSENPKALMLKKNFESYASGKDDNKQAYMTVDDLVKFIKDTDSGTKEPQPAVAKNGDTPVPADKTPFSVIDKGKELNKKTQEKNDTLADIIRKGGI